jgi:polyisoprenoid-binding protein YceI
MSSITDLTPTSITKLTPGVWNVDPSHSRVGFVARHLMVSKVRGNFGTFSGALTIADNPLESTVDATVETGSIATGDETRDGHVKSADFFDSEHFPTMTLVTTGIDKRGSDYVLHTNLTIKGITKPVDFDLEFDGVNDDPWGGTRAGFTAEADVNRKDWGLEWNVVVETGGVVLGDKVKLELEIEAIRA